MSCEDWFFNPNTHVDLPLGYSPPLPQQPQRFQPKLRYEWPQLSDQDASLEKEDFFSYLPNEIILEILQRVLRKSCIDLTHKPAKEGYSPKVDHFPDTKLIFRLAGVCSRWRWVVQQSVTHCDLSQLSKLYMADAMLANVTQNFPRLRVLRVSWHTSNLGLAEIGRNCRMLQDLSLHNCYKGKTIL